MKWLSDLWFDLKLAWMGFRMDREIYKDWRKETSTDWDDELARMREKGL